MGCCVWGVLGAVCGVFWCVLSVVLGAVCGVCGVLCAGCAGS